jgi:hypothetical protein
VQGLRERKTMKLVLKQPMLVGDRSYSAGAVIEVNDVRAKELLELDHAKPYVPPMQTATVEPPQKAVAKAKK